LRRAVCRGEREKVNEAAAIASLQFCNLVAARAPIENHPRVAGSTSIQTQHSSQTSPGQFAPTRWSVVLAARSDSTHAHAALEKLCGTYWPPIYAFVRRQGHNPHDAQDLTQAFFARLL